MTNINFFCATGGLTGGVAQDSIAIIPCYRDIPGRFTFIMRPNYPLFLTLTAEDKHWFISANIWWFKSFKGYMVDNETHYAFDMMRFYPLVYQVETPFGLWWKQELDFNLSYIAKVIWGETTFWAISTHSTAQMGWANRKIIVTARNHIDDNTERRIVNGILLIKFEIIYRVYEMINETLTELYSYIDKNIDVWIIADRDDVRFAEIVNGAVVIHNPHAIKIQDKIPYHGIDFHFDGNKEYDVEYRIRILEIGYDADTYDKTIENNNLRIIAEATFSGKDLDIFLEDFEPLGHYILLCYSFRERYIYDPVTDTIRTERYDAAYTLLRYYFQIQSQGELTIRFSAIVPASERDKWHEYDGHFFFKDKKLGDELYTLSICAPKKAPSTISDMVWKGHVLGIVSEIPTDPPPTAGDRYILSTTGQIITYNGVNWQFETPISSIPSGNPLIPSTPVVWCVYNKGEDARYHYVENNWIRGYEPILSFTNPPYTHDPPLLVPSSLNYAIITLKRNNETIYQERFPLNFYSRAFVIYPIPFVSGYTEIGSWHFEGRFLFERGLTRKI